MPNNPPVPPAYAPGAGQGGYWYRPPFTPRFSIPQTFGEALSYEAQIHWLAGMCADADAMLRTLSAVHLYYGSTAVDTSAFTAYEPFAYDAADVPDADQPKPGDWVGLVVPEADARYLSTHALVFARVSEWGQPCNRLSLSWYYTVHDPTAWLAQLAGYVSDLRTRVASLETRVSSAESDIDALEGRATALENRMGSAEDRIETAEETIGEHGDAITALQNSVVNLTTAVTNLENDLTVLSNTVADHTQSIQQLGDRVADLASSTAKTLADIVGKVYGGGTVDPTTGAVTWGSAATVPVGNINIYSTNGEPSPSSSVGIITHANVLDNDVWVK